MKHVYIICFAFAVSIASAIPFSEDIYMFLPLLRSFVAPPPCPSNELYTTCIRNCSDCEQRGRCVIPTCVPGCDCAPRFYRVTPDGPCVPVGNCPIPECSENEVFRECGPICERCTTLECHVISCDHKCYCNQGYVRNQEGKCIPKDECPKRERCFRNEEWAESGLVNEFCLRGDTETLNIETQTVSQCYCKEGFKRNALGTCVNETLCSMIKCLGVEVYHDCIPKCNTTCRNYGNPNCTEDDNCYPGCFCPPGYVMNDFRSCIPHEECSLNITQVKVFVSSETTEEEDDDDEPDDANPPSSKNDTDITVSTEQEDDDDESDDANLPSSKTDADITVSTEETHSVETVENYTKSTVEDIMDEESSTTATPVNGAVAKAKSQTEKGTKYTKHENVAKTKESSKEKLSESDEDFNDNI